MVEPVKMINVESSQANYGDFTRIVCWWNSFTIKPTASVGNIISRFSHQNGGLTWFAPTLVKFLVDEFLEMFGGCSMMFGGFELMFVDI